MKGLAFGFIGTVALTLTGCNSSDGDAPGRDEAAEQQLREWANQAEMNEAHAEAGATASAEDPVDQSDPNPSALSIIRDAGHDCSSVLSVRRLSDSSLATC